jgi:hypothetical protein
MSKHSLQWIAPSTLKVHGVIDEDVLFEPYIARFGTEAVVDFSGVTRINSCGVRQWTRAIAACSTRIRYVNAPALIVDQFSMVPEFLGVNGTVESFQARYVCSACSHEEMVLLAVGSTVAKGVAARGSATPPPHACSQCGAPADMDHNPDVYLEFLSHMA